MLTFDVVITTYNRPDEVHRLTAQILECESKPGWIIVVDSSDIQNEELANNPSVLYIRSSHKNQPYQRLLGAMASKADVVVFLDDDLVITNSNIFTLLMAPLQDREIVGSSVAFQYIQSSHYNSSYHQNSLMIKLILSITGVPSPSQGTVSRLGVVGLKPLQSGCVQTFHGAVMAFRKEVFLSNLPISLFALYEVKLGKGEDKIISMINSKSGRLFFNPEVCLLHPENDSSYLDTDFGFNVRVTYSRLYHSKVYAECYSKKFWVEVILFHYYTLWRWLIAGFKCLLNPSRPKWQKFAGITYGWWLSVILRQRPESLTPGIDWESELLKDIEQADVKG